jgi:GT2 family glycosyltransferase
VAFIDDDVVADAGWAAALIARFEDDRVGVCTGRVEALVTETAGQRLFEANGGFSRGHEPLRLPADAHRPLHGMRAPLIAWAVSIGAGCSMAVRRELALALGSFDVTFGPGTESRGAEEHDLIWRVLQAGRDVVYEPTALAWHDHRPDLESAHRQIVGHQRALIAFLWKTMRRTTGRARLPVAAFLGWRLVKPGARVMRRLAGRDPLPVSLLWKMWRESWRGLSPSRARPAAVPRLRTRTSEHEEWNPASSS